MTVICDNHKSLRVVILTIKCTIKKGVVSIYQGLEEINNLGFNKSDVPVKIKSLLYTSLTRSKLLYGFENFNIKDKDLSKTHYHP